jgi:single-stranded-DNA-specific exonuclease
MDADVAFLDVSRSLTGRRWRGPGAAVERAAMAIAQATGLPEIVARILAASGVEADAAEAYMAPTLRALMPDPSTLADMDGAARRLAVAAARRQRIAVFGDYDVDGAASAALVVDWLRALGQDATVYIPDRIDEGYGPNVAAMERLGAAHELVLCVDCGTAAPAPVAAARARGADVIVIDHHLPGAELPDAVCVNPNRADCGSGLGQLAAAGVVFLLLVAANRVMRDERLLDGRAPPELMPMLDLVAVATVADVAPLTGLNRAYVRQGLAVLSQRRRPGLAALADVAGLTAPPCSADLGFAIGPRINAGGRIGDADLGVRLLTTRDWHEAEALAERLDALNRERRAIEAAVLDAACEQVEARGAGALAWAAGRGWHPGVVGIVASRLKDRYNRPAVVIGIDGEAGAGSGRSVPGIDLGSAIASLTARGVLLRGGGHRMAAGLSVAADRVEEAMEELSAMLSASGADEIGPEDLAVMGAIAPGGCTAELVQRLETAGPFGPGNPAPRLALGHVVPSGVRAVGNGHCLARFESLGAVAFRAEGNGIAQALEAAAGTRRPLHVAGRLELDDWGGRRQARLTIEDVAEPR